jgi:tetrahydromethanopterin S-methyltransferase subunit B
MKSFLAVRYQPKGRKTTDLNALNMRQILEPVVLGLNERNSKTSIIVASILAALCGVATSINAYMNNDLMVGISGVLLLAMAYGIYRRIRTFAVIAFLFYVVNRLFDPESITGLAVAIGIGLFGGILGTLAIHELEREKERKPLVDAAGQSAAKN